MDIIMDRTFYLDMDDQVSTAFYVNLLWAAFSYALLHIQSIYIKEKSDKRHKIKCSNRECELQIFTLVGATLLAYYFVFNSLPINPLKILCNKELALCLPPITASWEQKPVSKSVGFLKGQSKIAMVFCLPEIS